MASSNFKETKLPTLNRYYVI